MMPQASETALGSGWQMGICDGLRFFILSFQCYDSVTVFERGFAVGDHQQRKTRVSRGDRGDRTVDLPFGAAVERRGRLVEEKHVGTSVEGACDADALPLSA